MQLALRRDGSSGHLKKGFGGYFDFVLTQPLGTADNDESVIGRVNMKRVRRWCDNSNSTYSQ